MISRIIKDRKTYIFNVDRHLLFLIGIDITYLFEITYKSDYYERDLAITLFGLHFYISILRNKSNIKKKKKVFSIFKLMPKLLLDCTGY